MKIADTLIGSILLGISFFSAAQSVPCQPQPLPAKGDMHSLQLNYADTAETPDEFIPSSVNIVQVRDKTSRSGSL